jgi:hypothetical protein
MGWDSENPRAQRPSRHPRGRLRWPAYHLRRFPRSSRTCLPMRWQARTWSGKHLRGAPVRASPERPAGSGCSRPAPRVGPACSRSGCRPVPGPDHLLDSSPRSRVPGASAVPPARPQKFRPQGARRVSIVRRRLGAADLFSRGDSSRIMSPRDERKPIAIRPERDHAAQCAQMCARTGDNGSGRGGRGRTDRRGTSRIDQHECHPTGPGWAIPDDRSISGGQGVAGSNPASPTVFPQVAGGMAVGQV